jgi:predicted short-subunit dehydrogenase-like oxidoreductase (DUF2520 family)
VKESMVYSVRIIGPGRAGMSLTGALKGTSFEVVGVLGRSDGPEAVAQAAHGVDLLVLAVPDREVPKVASIVEPNSSTVVAHMAGSLGLDALWPHERRASMHPLVPLVDERIGALRLRQGCIFAVEGDPLVVELVETLGGRTISLDPSKRVAYHAAACIAANHVVALMSQVERIAARAGLSLGDFEGLAKLALEDAFALGPSHAITGPAARGDTVTLQAHRTEMGPVDRQAYDALARLAGMLPKDKGGLLPDEHTGEPPKEQVLDERARVLATEAVG